MKIQQLQNQANQAPKFVLMTNQYGYDLFIADKKLSGGLEATDNVNEALKFSVGFDDEQMKLKSWSGRTGWDLKVKSL